MSADDSPRPGTFYDKLGDRHYRDPLNSTVTWIGVSAILAIRKAEQLEAARRKAIALYAAKHRKSLALVSRAPDVIAELLDEDVTLPEWKRKRDEGTLAHQAIDDLVNGRPVAVASDPDDPRYWAPRRWSQFLEDTRFTPVDTEQTVISDRFGYGGSYDLYGLLPDGTRCLVDVKTNYWGPKPETGYQLEFYDPAHTDFRLDCATGERAPMHPVDRHYVLWLRPDGYAWRPMLSGPEVWRECFARLLTYRNDLAPRMLGDREAGQLDPPARFW